LTRGTVLHDSFPVFVVSPQIAQMFADSFQWYEVLRRSNSSYLRISAPSAASSAFCVGSAVTRLIRHLLGVLGAIRGSTLCSSYAWSNGGDGEMCVWIKREAN
jgi:hypothetical protein